MENNIGRLLRQAGKTQIDLAQAIGRTPGTVSRYCAGLAAPERKIAGRIARYLRVRVGDLELRQRKRTGPRPEVGPIDTDVLRQALRGLQMSEAKLARRVHVSRQAINAVLRGESTPSAKTLRRICSILDLDTRRLALDHG